MTGPFSQQNGAKGFEPLGDEIPQLVKVKDYTQWVIIIATFALAMINVIGKEVHQTWIITTEFS